MRCSTRLRPLPIRSATHATTPFARATAARARHLVKPQLRLFRHRSDLEGFGMDACVRATCSGVAHGLPPLNE